MVVLKPPWFLPRQSYRNPFYQDFFHQLKSSMISMQWSGIQTTSYTILYCTPFPQYSIPCFEGRWSNHFHEQACRQCGRAASSVCWESSQVIGVAVTGVFLRSSNISNPPIQKADCFSFFSDSRSDKYGISMKSPMDGQNASCVLLVHIIIQSEFATSRPTKVWKKMFANTAKRKERWYAGSGEFRPKALGFCFRPK